MLFGQWLMEYSSLAYEQAGLSICWSQIQHCWKSHVAAHMWYKMVIPCTSLMFKDRGLMNFKSSINVD